ncbi:MAG: cell division protein ZipA [Gammaproteobacteria bacterium]|nr:MAG: cell division protein ZipA [Gammaproteobacteria bacterium]
MDSSLREWLVIIGLIIIVAVVFDGWRRVRRARQDSLDIAKGMGGEVSGAPLEDEEFNPELPNGGYRIVGKAGPHEGSSVRADNETEAEQVTLAATGDRNLLNTAHDVDQAGLHAHRDSDKGLETPAGLSATPEDVAVVEDAAAAPHEVKRTEAGAAAGEAPVNAEEFLMVNVVARTADGFAGPVIRDVAEACGMTLNAQGLYVRHEQDTGVGPVQFSMANASESGRFDELDLDETRVRGLIFFVGLPGPEDPLKAFDYMLEMARYLADKLGGELRDEQHSDMTQQTIDYCRQRIRDYLRRQKLAGGRH